MTEYVQKTKWGRTDHNARHTDVRWSSDNEMETLVREETKRPSDDAMDGATILR